MMNIGRSTCRSFLNLRLVLVVLASAFLISVPAYFGELCFYNWEFLWHIALMLWIAALALLLGRWWSKLVAIALSGFPLYHFIMVALKVHGLVALSPEEGQWWAEMPPEVWWGFTLRSPWEMIPLTLSTLILVYSAISLWVEIYRRRIVLP